MALASCHCHLTKVDIYMIVYRTGGCMSVADHMIGMQDNQSFFQPLGQRSKNQEVHVELHSSVQLTQ